MSDTQIEASNPKLAAYHTVRPKSSRVDLVLLPGRPFELNVWGATWRIGTEEVSLNVPSSTLAQCYSPIATHGDGKVASNLDTLDVA